MSNRNTGQSAVTVQALIKYLQTLPPKMKVLFEQYSDYSPLTLDQIKMEQAVDQGNDWVMRAHPTMSDENKSKTKTYVVFPGN